MARLATLLKGATAARHQEPSRPQLRVEPDLYRLRSLPNEDVFFFCKRIDNTRLVREPDPRARVQCWSTIGAATAVVALLASVMMPSAASTMAGYRIQELKSEEQRLLDERRVLELEEARLLNPSRLEVLAHNRELAAPAPNQVVHLDPKADGSLAFNVKK